MARMRWAAPGRSWRRWSISSAMSAVFFGMRRPGLALIDIGCLWLAILGNTVTFFAVRPEAGWLLVPCLLRVSFAFLLNHAIWRLDPHETGRIA